MGILGGILGDLIKPVKDIVSEVVVDKDKARELNVRLQELADRADQRIHDQTMGQIATNQMEAQHPSVFVAGWRPFVGWTGGVGLAYAAIIQPLGSWIARVAGYTGDFPVLDNNLLLIVLGGMLGIGGMRSFDKYHGVDTKRVQRKDD